jgi:hypothetical protein
VVTSGKWAAGVLIIVVCLLGVMTASRMLLATSANGILPPHSKSSLRLSAKAAYPLHSRRFEALVGESRRCCTVGEPNDFYKWLNGKYETSHFKLPGKEKLSLSQALRAEKRELASIRNVNRKADAEIAIGQRLHRLIKTAIPRFSLERGFEFSNVVRYGARQCFLQSAIIAGLMQEMGINAGVVMVYRNPRGEESNNGHAIVLVKLPNGRDTIVDASDPEAFIKQQGLFVRSIDYRYVNPIYDAKSPTIDSYKLASNGRALDTTQVLPLDYGFIRSQFWYYRGERAPGGVFAAKPTTEGLKSSAYALRTSVWLCPKNPLAVYMLGRAYMLQGNKAEARKRFNTANALYTRFGWVPPGEKAALALVK